MKYITLVFTLLFTQVNTFSQQITLTGQILNSNNVPIALASINIVGNNLNDTSDDLGLFHIALPSIIKKGDIIVLRVAKEGYNTVTKKIPVSFLSIPIKLIKNKKNGGKPHPLTENKKFPMPSLQQPTTVVPPVNVTSLFQSGGITANQVTIAPLARKIDDNNSLQLINNLPDKNEKINVTSVMGDSEAFQFANEVLDFLKAKGYKKVDGVNQAMFTRPVVGQSINRDTSGIKIIIGARQ